MKVTVIPIRELSESLKQSWLNIQASNPNLSGPCFHPELFIEVGKITPNAYIGIMYSGNRLLGFLPFRLDKTSAIAKPIEFCYYETIIGPQHQNWDIDNILSKSGLNGWEFVALADFKHIRSASSQVERIDIPRVDLSCGIEKYLTILKERKIELDGLMVKKRELERKIGPIRFVSICDDVKALHLLLPWKIIRFKRDLDWVKNGTELLERLFYLPRSGFSGLLSVLYVGDDILSSQFCLRYQGIMQAYVIAFNPAYSKYSPGMLLLYYLISELQTLHCKILDLGAGGEKYKKDLANNFFPVIKGGFKTVTLKDKIKSVDWLYQGLFPLVQIKKIIETKTKGIQLDFLQSRKNALR